MNHMMLRLANGVFMCYPFNNQWKIASQKKQIQSLASKTLVRNRGTSYYVKNQLPFTGTSSGIFLV